MAADAEQSRRPHLSPRRAEAEIEQRLVTLRRERPDWGARKLELLLTRKGLELPPATVRLILLRHGLVRLEGRHAPAQRRFERDNPNQLWQMDFKSPKEWGQPVGPLSVIDDRSRQAITLFQTGSTQAKAVREQLEAFADCGLP